MPRKTKPGVRSETVEEPQDKNKKAELSGEMQTEPDTPVRSTRKRSKSPKLFLIKSGQAVDENAFALENLTEKRTAAGADGTGADDPYEQEFHPLRGETVKGFLRARSNYATQFQSLDPVTRELLYQLAIVHFDIKRSENAMYRLSLESYEHQPETWLKLHSGFATQRNGLQLASQRLMGTLERLALDDDEAEDAHNRNTEGLALRDADGKRIEEYRFWNVYKFSEDPNDLINEAMEVVCYTDGTARTEQTVPLKEFMNGEFMKAEYGLADQFRRMLRQYKRPLHHPFDPDRIT